MKPPEDIYTEICLAADTAAALRELGAGALSRLIRHLREMGADGGVPGIVLGMAEMEATERFLKIQENKA